ncbi:MAG: enoyl-CoA hydratase-related protein [Actinomycetota bacterium]
MARQLETGTDDLLARVEGGVGVITLHRPKRRNALSTAMYGGFDTVLPRFLADDEVRVVMVTGTGTAFCAGGDVKQMDENNQSAAESGGGGGLSVEETVAELRLRQRSVSLTLHRFPKPVVAALPGPAAGAGLSIALSADLRIAAERAILVTAFTSIGASGDFGGSWFLTRLVGQAKAKELYFWSPRLPASEAERLGIVNKVLPDEDFEQHALDYCAELAARAPIGLRYAKENINRALDVDLASALDAEALAMRLSMSTDDHAEAAAAFVEKRPPVFHGR